MGIVDYKHIFIVDDVEMFAEMLKDYLCKEPIYKVSVFNTGEECLKNLFQNPDVIILDYYLNDNSKEAVDGLEVLTEIKKHSSNIHVLMLSGQEHYGIALQTIAKGAEQYVIKNDQSIKGKIALYLLEQVKIMDSDTILLGKSQAQLSELFGVTRPSLGRAIRELDQEGLIEAKAKQITILDRNGLSRLLN